MLRVYLLLSLLVLTAAIWLMARPPYEVKLIGMALLFAVPAGWLIFLGSGRREP